MTNTGLYEHVAFVLLAAHELTSIQPEQGASTALKARGAGLVQALHYMPARLAHGGVPHAAC